MNFTDIFIKRPVFATVLSLILLLVGLISFSKLSVRQYPEVDNTAITITTSYPGASAKLMEGFITTPIENAISGIDGIDYITSNSQQSQSVITVHFNLGTDINTAAADVANKVQSARWKLPQSINDPIIEKRDPNAQPTLFVGFQSKSMNPQDIIDYLNRVVVPQLATLPGVGQAQIYGSPYAMRIWLNPYEMAAHQITVSDLENALTNNNQQSPTGVIETANSLLNVNAGTDLNTAKEFNNLVIKNENGQLIKIKDVGKAELGAETNDFSIYINGKKGVILAITPQPNANPLDVSNVVKKTLHNIQTQLPKDLNMQINWDISKFISTSVHEVEKTVIESVLAVILVMFFFLGSTRVLAIPAVTIPLSLIGVCTLMLLMGFSINGLTLLAMVLAIGMVVDDAIVVTENIYRHIEAGTASYQAAITGAREIKFAIIAMTLTLAIVYAPIGFLSDITGALFREFAFSLAASVIISGFIALTLSPMMCSKILRPVKKESKLAHYINKIFSQLVRIYSRALTFVLRHLKWVAAFVVLIICCVVFFYKILPKELAPSEDAGAVLTSITGPPAANLAYMEKYTSQLPAIFDKVPEKESYVVINGMNDQTNSGISFLILKDWDKRKRSVQQIIQSLFPSLWGITGIQAFPVNPFRLPGSNDFMPVKFIMKSTGSYADLANATNKLVALANSNPGFANVNTDLKFDEPQLDLQIDRNKAADLGISMNDIGQTINFALGEPVNGHFEKNGRSYDIVPELAPEFRNQPDALDNLYLRNQTNSLIPLSNLVTINEITAPETLAHFQQERAATITSSLKPGYTLSEALEFLETNAKKVMTPDMQYDFGGTSRQFMQSSSSIQKTFVLALIFIILVLAAQFESFLDPFIVLFSVIPAIFGALATLKLTGGTMNIYTQIGLITLIGLISKHGILMVEFANQLREKGRSIQEAIIESATIRLRPILMTTLAMIIGAVPLILSTGAGAMSRQQMGWTITGGMLFGTCITLFIVPSAYLIMNRLWSKRKQTTSEITSSIDGTEINS